MKRQDASDLLAFLAVARERSFTRAAAKLGITQSALSQIIRGLENRVGLRLLNRTTRNVTLTATEYAATEILLPALGRILPKYPEIRVEVIIDYGLTNIVAEQVDAGIRPGELVEKDMIAVRVSPDLRMAVVGSPSYFAARKRPRTPQELTNHNCLNLRLPTHGGSLYAWEFEKNGRELNVRVEGQLVFNSAGLLLQGALKGLGLAYLTQGHVQPYIARGQLVRVLSDWCPPFSGYHLYYTSRRQVSPAFSLIVDALRYRGQVG
jgi:DNA-binding transcriptional LysR family regulator